MIVISLPSSFPLLHLLITNIFHLSLHLLLLSPIVMELQGIESLQPLVISTKNLLLENIRLANSNIKPAQYKGIGFKVSVTDVLFCVPIILSICSYFDVRTCHNDLP